MLHLAGFGGEQLVKLRVLGEVVRKGQDDIVEEQQPVAGVGIGHIGKLLRGDVQPLRQYLPVAGGLVEHIDEIAVFQNVLDLRGGKQIFGVLRRPGRHAAPLSEPFPNLGAVCCGLFLLQQKVELVHEIPGRPADGPVDGDGVPHRVLDNEHTGLFQVLAQALDVKADKAVADVHGGAVVKEVQRTVHIQVQRLSYPVGLRDALCQKRLHQIAQDGHILRSGVGKIRLIDLLHSPVDDGFFDGLQPCLTAHDELAEGQDKVGFQRQRVLLVRVVEIDVQGVHIVGAGRRQPDHLTSQPLHQRRIFILRVADDDIIFGGQDDEGDLPLAAHGFAAARRTKHQTVGTPRLLAVQQDHVVGEGVQAVIHGLAAHEQFLGDKGDEHRQGRCGQAPFDLDTVEAQRKAAHQPILLLEVQPGEKAVVGLGNAGRLRYSDFQLLLGCRHVHDQEGQIEHSLVSALQVLEDGFCRAAVGGKVAGEDVHVIPAAHCPLLLRNLHGVQVGDLPLDHFNGFVLVDAPDVHSHQDIALGLHKLRQNAVVDLRGGDLQKADCAVHLADAEGTGFSEMEGGWGDEVLDRKAAGRQPVPIESEPSTLRMKDAVKQLQPLFPVQHMGGGTHDLEAVEGVGLNTGKPSPRRRQVLRLDGQGDILGFYIAVAAPFILETEYPGCVLTDGVQVVALGTDAEQVLLRSMLHIPAAECHLHPNGGVIAVIEVAEAFKDAPLILRPCQTVIHILIGDGLGEGTAIQPAQAVREHIAERDAVLHRMGFPIALCLPDHRLDLPALIAGQLTSGLCRFSGSCGFCLQSLSPPVPIRAAAQARSTGCWFGRSAPLGG